MTNEEFLAGMSACLNAHLEQRPIAQASDVVKFVFQSMLGVGHLLGTVDQVEAYIAREMESQAADPEEPLTESVGRDWCRLNLRRAMAEELPPRVIAKLMMNGVPEQIWTRKDVVGFCTDYAQTHGIPGMEDALVRLADPAWLPSHSEAYRAAYRPAYRLIPRAWEPLLPAICEVVRKAESGQRVLITLDGPCASGKTTLAEKLGAILDAAVLHTDHFVVPHPQKTPERLAIPGGNCDWERLTAEVITPWKEGKDGTFRRYDWNVRGLMPPEPLPGQQILILEGSYCNLPAIREHADIRLFMNTPIALRRQRLEQRESPASLKMFDERWIPLENAYFEAYGLPDEGCILI